MKNTHKLEKSHESFTLNPRMWWGGPIETRVVTMVFVLGLFVTCLNIHAAVGSEERDPYRGFVDGTVTAIGEKTIYINDRPYAVKSDVEVKDQSGQPVEYRKIETGDHVRYLVQDGMIIKIIVIHPS